MSENKFKRSLQLKLLAPTLAALLVFAVLLHFAWRPDLLKEARQSFQTNQVQMLVMLDEALVSLLLSNDLAQAQATLDRIRRTTPQWIEVTLLDAGGQRIYPLHASPPVSHDDAIGFDQRITYSDAQLGTLHVIADPTSELEHVAKRIDSIETGLLALATLLAFSLLWLQRRLITRPLRHLTQAAERLAEGDYDAVLPQASADEVGAMVRAFDAMRGKRKQAEGELYSANQLLDSILENLPDMVFLKDAHELRFQRFNRAGEELLGYRREDLIGRNDYDFFPTEQADFFTAKDREVLAQEHALDIPEEPIETPSGTRILHTRKIAIRNEQDQPQFLLGISEDITERKQAEAALRESEEKLRGMYELSPLGIALTDMKGQYIEFNSAFEKICGYPMDELNKLDYWALTPKKYADDEARQLESLRATGHYGPYEKEYIRKDGSLIPIRLNGLLLTGRNGEQYIWSIVEDITEHKAFEQELKRSNAELEHFSYAASHDMRQPLRMISSYLQLLEEELGRKLTPEQLEYFGFAVNGAQRLDRMLHGMLEYSRVGRKGAPLSREDSRKLLDEALLLHKSNIEQTQATLDIAGDWPQLVVSRDEFVRLLQNLIGNALKYRRSDVAPHLALTGKIEDRMWRLCVMDNGIGIDPAQIGRLFQMFQRLHASDKYEGSGIGLALCRRIAEHHGGRIWAESAGTGMGTTFCVAIPQGQEDLTE